MKARLKGKFTFSRTDYAIILGLLLLSAIPVIAGIFRANQLATGVVTNENVRFYACSSPVIIHIVSVTIYSLLGAFQFAPGFRKQYMNLHRQNGKVLLVAATLTAITGLWMTLVYPFATLDGTFVYLVRIFVGITMSVFIVLGIRAIYNRNYIEHGRWMIRTYAIALGAGTQVFTHIPWILFPKTKNEFTRATFMTLGWVINIVVAECVIQTNKLKKENI